jgi:hypothetical protein
MSFITKDWVRIGNRRFGVALLYLIAQTKNISLYDSEAIIQKYPIALLYYWA